MCSISISFKIDPYWAVLKNIYFRPLLTFTTVSLASLR